MKFNNIKLKRKIKKLIKKAERLNLIKTSDDAFKEFPVENEIHKGNINAYRKVSGKI